ncbi:hypothetical protein BU24DRAFT_196687 [Aaosphaeria arxii CBS 175.79]|uniref:Protein YOP1 n=1 Tax=Aaosphaeria arxii CBS 175.79 TaxID=1450172 RepID=A0A6A5XS90_9PLEO|nr:uncharacterized protein BU24DRAFT_196687 [Aaosphaeria arxii CBS 175.79]KAF2016205.1 hypothetical protein BU24DRAFT_196687 [Aaosphaeria arxii CBS 175.79]
MFGFIADGLTVALTVLFPVFASYKALHTSDPAVLAPWLIYFMVLMLFHTVENTFDFILSWVPFYSWLRLFLHVYLIMPGSQGATYLYTEHIEPLLYHHEREIDDFITDTHSKAKAAGLIYAEKAVEWIKVNVLGFAPKKPDTPPATGQTYAQNFMSRFAMPSARGGDNFTNLLSQALSGAGAMYAGNQGAQAAELSRGSTLIPESIRNNDDRMSYVASQRQRLETLMQAFDREQDNLRTARDSGSRYYEGGSSGGPGLSRNRSEGEFDRIERDEIGSDRPPYPTTPPALGRRTSSGWMPWNWRQGQPIPDDPLAYGKDHSQSSSSQGRSTGYDGGR